MGYLRVQQHKDLVFSFFWVFLHLIFSKKIDRYQICCFDSKKLLEGSKIITNCKNVLSVSVSTW